MWKATVATVLASLCVTSSLHAGSHHSSSQSCVKESHRSRIVTRIVSRERHVLSRCFSACKPKCHKPKCCAPKPKCCLKKVCHTELVPVTKCQTVCVPCQPQCCGPKPVIVDKPACGEPEPTPMPLPAEDPAVIESPIAPGVPEVEAETSTFEKGTLTATNWIQVQPQRVCGPNGCRLVYPSTPQFATPVVSSLQRIAQARANAMAARAYRGHLRRQSGYGFEGVGWSSNLNSLSTCAKGRRPTNIRTQIPGSVTAVARGRDGMYYGVRLYH